MSNTKAKKQQKKLKQNEPKLTPEQQRMLDNAKDTAYYRMKMTKRDWITVGIMMLIYSVIAFIFLGTFNTPQTYWTTVEYGDYVVVDLGEEHELDRINVYAGVIADGEVSFQYLNEENGQYMPLYKWDSSTNMPKKAGSFDYGVYKIHSADVVDSGNNKIRARYVKVTATSRNLAVLEIGFFVDGSKEPLKGVTVSENGVKEGNGDPSLMFDEPDTMEYSYNVFNSTYFDEIYHGRTGVEHLDGIRPYEWTHPPLGKLLIALGMAIFGKNMFGMRFMGTFFGVLMLPLMYMFGKKITRSSLGGFASAFLMMFDFMHFSHSRIASIDIYAVTFVILMFYFIYDYFVSKPQNLGLKKSMLYLLASGFFMGCAISVKWNTAYGALGLAVTFFAALLMQWRDMTVLKANKLENEYKWVNKFGSDYVVKIGILCVFAFIVLPVTFYLATFIPYMNVTDTVNGSAYTFKQVLDLQYSVDPNTGAVNGYSIFGYHSQLTATHSYQSAWYTWPFIGRPLYMYASADNVNGIRGVITTMGNPAIWWMGVAAVIMSIMIAFEKKDRRMVPVFIALASLYLPWMLITRSTYIYHFFPVLPFVIFCIAYVLVYIKDNFKNGKKYIAGYFAVVIIFFVIFYPVISGIPFSAKYIEGLRWFPSWSW